MGNIAASPSDRCWSSHHDWLVAHGAAIASGLLVKILWGVPVGVALDYAIVLNFAHCYFREAGLRIVNGGPPGGYQRGRGLVQGRGQYPDGVL